MHENHRWIQLQGIDKTLEGAARYVLPLLNVHKMKFVEEHGANQSYDFYWEAKKGGIRYIVHGNSWFPKEVQTSITLTLEGKKLESRLQEVLNIVAEKGWKFKLDDKPAQLETLEDVLRAYETALDELSWEKLAQLICPDAIFRSPQGDHHGADEIKPVFEQYFARLAAISKKTSKRAKHFIHAVDWIECTEGSALCSFRFGYFAGYLESKPVQGAGRATLLFVQRDGAWKIKHKHFSADAARRSGKL
jgi:ketosteroid isomerase-like protein